MDKEKDLGMSGISTLAGLGVLIVILLFVFRADFKTDHTTLASFGSYFGGILTGVGVIITAISFAIQTKNHKRELNDRSKAENYKLATNLINHCTRFEEEKKYIDELYQDYVSKNHNSRDADYLEHIIKKIEGVGEVIDSANEIFEDGLLHDHDRFKIMTMQIEYMNNTLFNLGPGLRILLKEGIIFRERLIKNPIILEFIRRNEE